MSPYYQDDLTTVHHGDCLEVLATLPEASVDAIVTDPPYALGFMDKTWDKQPNFQGWCRTWAVECLRVLKPGGHMLAFGSPRTWHRLACGVEDAGFELRDQIAWLYAGSAVPKSLDVAKAIDKESNNNRERQLEFTKWMRSTGITAREIYEASGTHMGNHYLSSKQQPAIPTEAIFEKLRPLLPKVPEHIEKLIIERTGDQFSAFARRVDRQVVKRNIDNHATPFTRAVVVNAGTPVLDEAKRWQGWGTALKPAFEPCLVARKPLVGTVADSVLTYGTGAINVNATRVNGTDGRWPTNLAIDEQVAADLDATTPGRSRVFPTFRFEAKAPTRERPKVDGVAHPTVKPLALMRWLVRLVTQPGGTVLDPFAGSGTTLEAAVLEGFNAIGIEREEIYLPLIMQRLGKPCDVPFNFVNITSPDKEARP